MQSATVTIQDRGPYVPDRIVDLSPGRNSRRIHCHSGKDPKPVDPVFTRLMARSKKAVGTAL